MFLGGSAPVWRSELGEEEVEGGVPQRVVEERPLPGSARSGEAASFAMQARSADPDLRPPATRAGMEHSRARVAHSSSATFGEVYDPFGRAAPMAVSEPAAASYSFAPFGVGPSHEGAPDESEVMGGIPRHAARVDLGSTAPPLRTDGLHSAAHNTARRDGTMSSGASHSPASALTADGKSAHDVSSAMGLWGTSHRTTYASTSAASMVLASHSAGRASGSSDAFGGLPLAEFSRLSVGSSVEGAREAAEGGGVPQLPSGRAGPSTAAPATSPLHAHGLSVTVPAPGDAPAMPPPSEASGVSPAGAVVSSVMQHAGGVSPDGSRSAPKW